VFLRAARRAGAEWTLDERTYPLVAALCHVAMGVPEALIELAQLSVRTPLETLAAASENQLAAFLEAAGSAYLRKVRGRLAAMSDAVRESHIALSLIDGTVESEVGLALPSVGWNTRGPAALA
jgi:predicted ATPase